MNYFDEHRFNFNENVLLYSPHQCNGVVSLILLSTWNKVSALLRWANICSKLTLKTPETSSKNVALVAITLNWCFLRDHPFSTYKSFRKTTISCPLMRMICVRNVKKCWYFEKILYVPNAWSPTEDLVFLIHFENDLTLK